MTLMSAQLTLTTVNKTVPTLSEASHAVVGVATPLTAVSAQTSTSAPSAQTTAHRPALTLLEASLAAAHKGSLPLTMGECALT